MNRGPWLTCHNRPLASEMIRTTEKKPTNTATIRFVSTIYPAGRLPLSAPPCCCPSFRPSCVLQMGDTSRFYVLLMSMSCVFAGSLLTSYSGSIRRIGASGSDSGNLYFYQHATSRRVPINIDSDCHPTLKNGRNGDRRSTRFENDSNNTRRNIQSGRSTNIKDVVPWQENPTG